MHRFADARVRDLWERSPRKIVVCAHTAPFIDGLVVHRALDDLATPHVVYSRGLRCFVPSWCQEINGAGGGFVSAETARLSELTEFCRVIFPSGGTVKWKSGFYHIAKATGATFFVLGIDYGLRTAVVVVDSALYPATGGSSDEIVAVAKTRLARYAPFPLYAPLRVLFGYGDEALDIARWKLWGARCAIICLPAAVFWL